MKLKIKLAELVPVADGLKNFVQEVRSMLGSKLLKIEMKNENTIIFKYRNLEYFIDAECQAESIEGLDKVIVVADTFLNTILNLNRKIETIDISKERNNLVVKYGKSYSKISILPDEDFQEIPAFKPLAVLTINANILNDLIKAVSFATNINSDIEITKSILFHIQNKKLSLAATDSNRLASASTITNLDFDGKALIPANSLIRSSKILTGEVKIGFDDRLLMIRSGKFLVMNRLFPAGFPDYEKIISVDDENCCKIKVDLKSMLEVVNTLISFNNYVFFELDFTTKEIVFTSKETSVGFTKQFISTSSIEGKDCPKVLLDMALIKDYLSTLSTENIEFTIYGELKPIIFKGENRFAVFMPLRGN